MRVVVRWILVAALIIVAYGPDCFAGTDRYVVDPDHSIVGFSVAHLVVSKTTGRFTEYTGSIDMDPDAKTVKAIEAVVQTA